MGHDQIVWELDYTEAIIKSHLGRSSKPWFRPPFGARNQRVLDTARDLGFRSIYWTLDPATGEPTPAGRGADASAQVGRPGRHRGPPRRRAPDRRGAAGDIDGIQSMGLRIVTVSELLGMPKQP